MLTLLGMLTLLQDDTYIIRGWGGCREVSVISTNVDTTTHR